MDFFRKKITGRKQGKNRAAREGTSKSRALWRGVLAFAARGVAERAPNGVRSGCGRAVRVPSLFSLCYLVSAEII